MSTADLVKDYYGKVLQGSADLKTSACCILEQLPPAINAIVSQVHEEIRSKFYGCGVIAPAAIEGSTVLDLGCGTGRDVYVLSKLVGERGRVIGVDMTKEQLEVAKKHQAHQAKVFGHKASNVSLRHGYIEDLAALDIASNSVDVVVSNCVINLSPAKEAVFKEIFRVLKPGGELHFSDVFANRRLGKAHMEDPVLLGECLGGAMYFEDFRREIAKAGCQDFRVLARAPIAITNADVALKVEGITFQSITVRAFKMDLEDRCEDYGQVAYYKGTIPGAPNSYVLDDHHEFEAMRPMLVCSNTARMLARSRFGEHFTIVGDESKHFGLFDCGPSPGTAPAAASTVMAPNANAACC